MATLWPQYWTSLTARIGSDLHAQARELLDADKGRLASTLGLGPDRHLAATAIPGRPYTRSRIVAPPREAITRQRLPQLVARQIAAGRLQPMLIVIAPTGPGCVDAPGGTQGETFLSQDLPTAIGTAYRVGAAPSGWSVVGPSTRGSAGYCAVLLAMRHSDRFGAAVFAAAALTPPAGGLYGGSRSIRDEYDPRGRLRHRHPHRSASASSRTTGSPPEPGRRCAPIGYPRPPGRTFPQCCAGWAPTSSPGARP